MITRKQARWALRVVTGLGGMAAFFWPWGAVALVFALSYFTYNALEAILEVQFLERQNESARAELNVMRVEVGELEQKSAEVLAETQAAVERYERQAAIHRYMLARAAESGGDAPAELHWMWVHEARASLYSWGIRPEDVERVIAGTAPIQPLIEHGSPPRARA